jgi:hypothetical protein
MGGICSTHGCDDLFVQLEEKEETNHRKMKTYRKEGRMEHKKDRKKRHKRLEVLPNYYISPTALLLLHQHPPPKKETPLKKTLMIAERKGRQREREREMQYLRNHIS